MLCHFDRAKRVEKSINTTFMFLDPSAALGVTREKPCVLRFLDYALSALLEMTERKIKKYKKRFADAF